MSGQNFSPEDDQPNNFGESSAYDEVPARDDSFGDPFGSFLSPASDRAHDDLINEYAAPDTLKRTASQRSTGSKRIVSKQASSRSSRSIGSKLGKSQFRGSMFGQIFTVVDQEEQADYDIRDQMVTFSVFDIFTTEGGLSAGLIRSVSLFSLYITIFLQILAALSVCMCFFVVCFSPVVEYDVMRPIFILDLVLDTIFFLSLILRCNITVMDTDIGFELVNRMAIVSRRLTQPSLWSDAISCLPGFIFCALGDYTTYSDRFQSVWHTIAFFLPLLRAARSWRVVQIGDSHREMSIVHPIIVATLLRFGLLILVGGHVFGCIWFSVVWSQESGRVMHFDVYNGDQPNILPDFFDIYSKSAMVGMYMLMGFDLEGSGGWENLLLCLAAPVGVLFNAYLLAEGLVEIQRRSAIAAKHQERSAFVQQAMMSLGIPAPLQLRVLSLNAYLHLHRPSMIDTQLFSGLPTNLNVEVRLFLYHSLVSNAQIFQQSHPTVIRLIVLELQDCAHLPGDYVVRIGEFGFEMFFVVKGRLGVLAGGRTGLEPQWPICWIDSGSYFGEVALLDHARRSATVRAETFCVLSKLSKDRFDPIVEQFPEQRDIIGFRIPNYPKDGRRGDYRTEPQADYGGVDTAPNTNTRSSDSEATSSRSSRRSYEPMDVTRSSLTSIPEATSLSKRSMRLSGSQRSFSGGLGAVNGACDQDSNDNDEPHNKRSSLLGSVIDEDLPFQDEDVDELFAADEGGDEEVYNAFDTNKSDGEAGGLLPREKQFFDERISAPMPVVSTFSGPFSFTKTQSLPHAQPAAASGRRRSSATGSQGLRRSSATIPDVLRLEPVESESERSERRASLRAQGLAASVGTNKRGSTQSIRNDALGGNASTVKRSSFADTDVGSGSNIGAYLPMGADMKTLKKIHKEAAKENHKEKDLSIITQLTNHVEVLDDIVESVEERQERMRDELQNEALGMQNALGGQLTQLSARLDQAIMVTKKLLQDKGLPVPALTTENPPSPVSPWSPFAQLSQLQ